MLVNSGDTTSNGNEKINLYKINFADSSFQDLTSNLPDFSNGGYLSTNNNYALSIAIKPDDENFVLIAGTNLFRVTNGFSSKPTDKKNCWIGGYSDTENFYETLPPNIFKITFDKNNPNKVWVGTGAGIFFTDDITSDSFTDYFPWQNKNCGYNTVQFSFL